MNTTTLTIEEFEELHNKNMVLLNKVSESFYKLEDSQKRVGLALEMLDKTIAEGTRSIDKNVN